MIRWWLVLLLLLGVHSPCFALTLAEQLTAWRTAQGLSQCAAAQRVMVSCTTWRRWEQGTSQPNAYNTATLTRLGILGVGETNVTLIFNDQSPPHALDRIAVEMPDGTTKVIE